MTKMHVLQYTKVCQCVLLDIQFHFHFHENAHPLDSRRIQCCGVGSSSNDPSSVGRERTMEGRVMYEGMESSNDPWKTSQIIAPLSDWAETTKRHNETVKRQTMTNRCGRWWVELVKTTSRRGQPTNRTDKTTRQTHKQMSRRILKTASRTMTYYDKDSASSLNKSENAILLIRFAITSLPANKNSRSWEK